jgi:hypothetical protein
MRWLLTIVPPGSGLCSAIDRPRAWPPAMNRGPAGTGFLLCDRSSGGVAPAGRGLSSRRDGGVVSGTNGKLRLISTADQSRSDYAEYSSATP